MDFYYIPPNTNLELSLMGDRVFCLAHFYIQDESYRKFFLDVRKNYPNVWITLDNSAAERALVTEEILYDIVGELQPSEVVAPDVLFDKDQTVANMNTFIEGMKERGFLQHTEIFGCPQGKTKEDWIECYDYFVSLPEVSTIGMSKIAIPYAFRENPEADQEIKETRHEAVKFLLETKRLSKPLHFLGMGDPTEYRFYAALDQAGKIFRSSDSCYTILAGANGIDLEKTPEVRKKTYDEYYHTPLTAEQYSLALRNMAFLKLYTNKS